MIIHRLRDYRDTHPTQPAELDSRKADADDWRAKVAELESERNSWISLHRIPPDARPEHPVTTAGYGFATKLCIVIAVVLVVAITWGA